MDTGIALLMNPPKKFRLKPKTFLLVFQNNGKMKFYQKWKFVLKMFLQTQGMQLWQLCWNFSTNGRKKFCSTTENNDENDVFFKSHSLSNCSSRHIQSTFDNSVDKFPLKSWCFWSSGQKWQIFIMFATKLLFFRIF